jgi:hypothetical protein
MSSMTIVFVPFSDPSILISEYDYDKSWLTPIRCLILHAADDEDVSDVGDTESKAEGADKIEGGDISNGASETDSSSPRRGSVSEPADRTSPAANSLFLAKSFPLAKSVVRAGSWLPSDKEREAGEEERVGLARPLPKVFSSRTVADDETDVGGVVVRGEYAGCEGGPEYGC